MKIHSRKDLQIAHGIAGAVFLGGALFVLFGLVEVLYVWFW